MAAVGQGDSRWIVKDRQDGTNVNGWHWTSKDFSEWFIEQMRDAWENKEIASVNGVTLKSLTISKVDLEASLRNRKGKANTFLDGSFALDWEATVGDQTVKGTLQVHELDPDFDDSNEIECRTSSGSGEAAEKALALVRKQGRDFIRAKVPDLITRFYDHSGVKELNAGKLQVEGLDSKVTRKAVVPAASAAPVAEEPKRTDRPSSFSYKVKWGCPARVVMDSLLTPQQLQAFTRAPATVDKRVGGAVTVLGGAIRWEITKLEEQKALHFKFRGADWPEGKWSQVALDFDSTSDSSTMTISQKDIPIADFERTQSSWKNIFWDPISRLFGYSMQIQ